VGEARGLDQDFDRRSVAERRSDGRARRKTSPRSGLGQWAPDTRRPDPVGLIEAQNQDRLPWLAPGSLGRLWRGSGLRQSCLPVDRCVCPPVGTGQRFAELSFGCGGTHNRLLHRVNLRLPGGN
jgi:hypothetical protein